MLILFLDSSNYLIESIRRLDRGGLKTYSRRKRIATLQGEENVHLKTNPVAELDNDNGKTLDFDLHIFLLGRLQVILDKHCLPHTFHMSKCAHISILVGEKEVKNQISYSEKEKV